MNSRCAGFNNMVFVKIISDLVANSTWLGNLRIAPLHSVIYAILPYSYPLLLICLNGFWPERSEITYGPEMSEITERCGPETTYNYYLALQAHQLNLLNVLNTTYTDPSVISVTDIA